MGHFWIDPEVPSTISDKISSLASGVSEELNKQQENIETGKDNFTQIIDLDGRANDFTASDDYEDLVSNSVYDEDGTFETPLVAEPEHFENHDHVMENDILTPPVQAPDAVKINQPEAGRNSPFDFIPAISGEMSELQYKGRDATA